MVRVKLLRLARGERKWQKRNHGLKWRQWRRIIRMPDGKTYPNSKLARSALWQNSDELKWTQLLIGTADWWVMDGALFGAKNFLWHFKIFCEHVHATRISFNINNKTGGSDFYEEVKCFSKCQTDKKTDSKRICWTCNKKTFYCPYFCLWVLN
jgi:hypothetical protein